MSWVSRHSWTVGEILTASNHNNNDSDLDYIAHEWDYAQITANTASITATSEGTAVAVVTGNSVTYDGGRVQFEFWCPEVNQGANTPVVTFVVIRDSTVIGHSPFTPISGSLAGPIHIVCFDTPTAAAHTYSVSAYVSGASIVVVAGAGGSGNNLPAFIRVTAAKSHP